MGVPLLLAPIASQAFIKTLTTPARVAPGPPEELIPPYQGDSTQGFMALIHALS